MSGEPVEKPVVAIPTNNYRKVMCYGLADRMERCFIVGHELKWREVPVIEEEEATNV